MTTDENSNLNKELPPIYFDTMDGIEPNLGQLLWGEPVILMARTEGGKSAFLRNHLKHLLESKGLHVQGLTKDKKFVLERPSELDDELTESSRTWFRQSTRFSIRKGFDDLNAHLTQTDGNHEESDDAHVSMALSMISWHDKNESNDALDMMSKYDEPLISKDDE